MHLQQGRAVQPKPSALYTRSYGFYDNTVITCTITRWPGKQPLTVWRGWVHPWTYTNSLSYIYVYIYVLHNIQTTVVTMVSLFSCSFACLFVCLIVYFNKVPLHNCISIRFPSSLIPRLHLYYNSTVYMYDPWATSGRRYVKIRPGSMFSTPFYGTPHVHVAHHTKDCTCTLSVAQYFRCTPQ